MDIKIYSNMMPDLDKHPVEMVERKGIGHPDTLADMIAMNFSNKYSNFALERFGVIPHHWADKVTIVGAQADIGYGYGILKEPMKIFQFGRVTSKVGNEKIDIDTLFKGATEDIFIRVFGDAFKKGVFRCQAITHSSSGPDHPKKFYNPPKANDIVDAEKQKSNDTIILSAFTPFTTLEEMVVETENFLNSKEFKMRHLATGYDIKVLAVKIEDKVDITACIPFIGERTPDFKTYRKELRCIKEEVIEIIKNYPFITTINLNTKDFGEYAYLTFMGTSCDKGGCGAVGRGNKYNGLITLNREMAVEAPAGKNPTHHSGRLYSEAIHRLSRDIYNQLGIRNYVNLVARNGDPMNDPAFVIIKGIDYISEMKKNKIREMIKYCMFQMSKMPYEVIKEDPIWSHINKPRELYKGEIT